MSVLSVDFDEQTADDWDVDMSVYYDKGILAVFYSCKAIHCFLFFLNRQADFL